MASQLRWFGAAVSHATGRSSHLPPFPFPASLAEVVDQHVSKASVAREKALREIQEATGSAIYDETLERFSSMSLEGDFSFDAEQYPIRESLLEACGFPSTTDLTTLHELGFGAKDRLLQGLTKQPRPVQLLMDRFLRDICAPRVAELYGPGLEEIYYQAFPCIRIVQPGEFSIGPHADVAYGHHPCSINFYIPLTPIGETASLFLESCPGRGDWHPIVGDYGTVKHFAGAICAHWTTENNTPSTRVSLDVRLVCGPMFEAIRGGDEKRDLFHTKAGYYEHCLRDVDGAWVRTSSDELPLPDARFGFPWTVRNWEKQRNRPKLQEDRLSEEKIQPGG